MTDNPQYRLVTNSGGLDALVREFPREAAVVAIDTEADSMHHYRTKLCVLQFTFGTAEGDALGTWIVDPLAGMDLTRLFALVSQIPLVIFHAADYDLRLLRQFYNWRPAAIFDTMLAARFVGELQFGLAALSEQHLGVTLRKEFQRHDWSVRPLNAEALAYAANDTIFTLKLYAILREQLQEAGRTEWHRQCCEREVEDAWAGEAVAVRDSERCWRVKGWQTLQSPAGLAVLRALWHWREEISERTDRPPFKILGNEYMVKTAKWTEQPLAQRGAAPTLPRNIHGRNYQSFQVTLNSAMAMARSECPSRRVQGVRPGLADVSVALGFLRKQRDEWVKDVGLDAGFAVPNSILESVVRAAPTTDEQLRGCVGILPWQCDVFGAQMLDALTRIPEEE